LLTIVVVEPWLRMPPQKIHARALWARRSEAGVGVDAVRIDRHRRHDD